jgi:CheY-like chemotaxis protein
MAMAKILVSEADPDVRRLLVVLIERLGHEAIVLDADVEVPPRTDLMLVEPDSDECLEEARLVLAYHPETPVLCLNAIPEAGGFLRRAGGPLGYLQKPFSLEHMRSTVQNALSSASCMSPV